MTILVPLLEKQRPKLNSQINPSQIFSTTLLMIKATNIGEIKDIISKLNKNKSTGPSSLPTKTLKLLKNDTFQY